MNTNYIYLLQEREFIRTNENIFKIGMTTKDNYKRFNQYPKGSILLFQIICDDCKKNESKIIKLMKEKFILRKDIGNEYFEGDYKSMIDLIYKNITFGNDIDEFENYKMDVVDDEESIEKNNEYEIKTFEDWFVNCPIEKIIIYNKKQMLGFIKFPNEAWINLHKIEERNYSSDYFEFEELKLINFIKRYQPLFGILQNKNTKKIIGFDDWNKLNNEECNDYISIDKVTFNTEEILQDSLKKCYNKNYEIYELGYHEFIIKCESKIKEGYFDCYYNSKNNVIIPIDDFLINIENKIVVKTEFSNGQSINLEMLNNIKIVDDFLDLLITKDIKNQFKLLMYNLFVENEEKEIIFYDYNEWLLSEWLSNLHFNLFNKNYMAISCDYYLDNKKFKKDVKMYKPRFVEIYFRSDINISIEQQIKDMKKIGFKYIVVKVIDKTMDIYNINKCIEFICSREIGEYFSNYVNEKYDRNYLFNNVSLDSIFLCNNLLYSNFFGWCCSK